MSETEPISKAEARAQAQRARILAAAKKCFVKHGFHAASMASIAETAQMSPGLIYRYFESKSEIILAIIEQQLELARAEIAKLDGSYDLPLEIWKSAAAPTCENRMNPILFLEMSSEASRDPKIAAAVRSSDLILRADFCDWLSRSPAQGGLGIPEPRNKAVGFLIQCILDGLRVRMVREPDMDLAVMKDALLTFLPRILSPETEES
ncbi:MAG TPA: TetR/AcrR family transcriptional regulator [Sphingomonadales bacterium]